MRTYTVTPYSQRFFAVWDGPELVVVTVYRKGAEHVADLLSQRPRLQRTERLRHGLTLREVAQASGYSIAWVSEVERGLASDLHGVLPAAIRKLVNPSLSHLKGIVPCQSSHSSPSGKSSSGQPPEARSAFRTAAGG